MLALMALRVPIAISMFIPGAVGYALLASPAVLLNYLKGAAWARLSIYDLSVIPLFLLMGQFATQGGLSRALFRFANSLIGHRRGGMAMAAVLACAAFGTICGSSVATAATVTQVALPEMRQRFADRNMLVPAGKNAQQFAATVKSDLQRWQALAKAIHLKAE